MESSATVSKVATPRLVELMCLDHRLAAVRRWPPGLVVDASCKECAAGVLPHVGRAKALPDFTAEQIEDQIAFHEAAHAVVGVDTGHPLKDIFIVPGGGNGKELAGQVTWGPWNMPILEHLAMVWAGQSGCMRWLAENGISTQANRVDMRYLAREDAAEVDRWREQHDLPSDAGLGLADRLVGLHWDRIVRLAGVLRERYRLTGAEATQIIGL